MKLPISNFEVLRIIKEKVKHLLGFLSTRLGSLSKCTTNLLRCSYLFLVFQSNPLIVQLIYFMSISFAGFLALKNLKPQHKPTPRNLDLMFTCVHTDSVKHGNNRYRGLFQLAALGFDHTDVIGRSIHFNARAALKNTQANTEDILRKRLPFISRDIESSNAFNNSDRNNMEGSQSEATMSKNQVQESKGMNQNSRNILAHVVAGYFIAAIVCSSVVITIYLWIDSDTRHLLKSKDIKIFTSSIFTAVSSFTNCSFTPVNNNMAIFRNNSGLLLIVTPQILAGNTLFAPPLRLGIWALGKVSRREEYAYMLQHPKETGYRHLQPQNNSVYLVLTVVGIILLQVMFICYFEWDSNALEGMNWFQKLVSSLFQPGEAIIDTSTLSPPILVLFALVMYLPSDTSFLPIYADSQLLTEKKENPNSRAMWKNFIITKPACLAVFTIMACITERKSISADPLNFNIFSIVFEVISAYGNVVGRIHCA